MCQSLGWIVDIFMSTNDCSRTGIPWESKLKEWYSPWLKSVITHVPCCRLRYGIQLLLDYSTEKGKGIDNYDAVIFGRPDLMIKPTGKKYIEDLITHSMHSIVWPFKCEDTAWKKW